MHRNPFPLSKSPLNSREKTIAAPLIFLDALEEKIALSDIGPLLRKAIGLQWSWISCIQYLSGKEAIGAQQALHEDWTQGGRNRNDIAVAILLAAQAVANIRSDGKPLGASDLAAKLKGVDFADLVGDAASLTLAHDPHH